MKKKFILGIFLGLALVFSAIGFAGCDLNKKSGSGSGMQRADIMEVFAEAQANGWTGTYDEWVEWIKTEAKGEKGDKGDTGAKGEKGDKGDQGDIPYIGENHNWWIAGEDTGILAEHKEETCTITFDYGKAKTFFENRKETVSVEYGKWIEELPEIPYHEAEHNAFLGWYVKGSDIKFNPTNEVKGNIKLYAKFDVTSDFASAGLYQNGKFVKTWNEIEREYPQAFDGDKMINVEQSAQGVIPICCFYGLTGELVMSDHITHIGDYSFKGSSLSFVKFGNNVQYVGYMAFGSCYRLTDILLNGVVKYIDYYAFDNCDRLNFNRYDNAYYLGTLNNPYYALIRPVSHKITSCEINDDCRVIQNGVFENCYFIERFNEFGGGYYLGSTESPYMALINIKLGEKDLQISEFCIYISNRGDKSGLESIGPNNAIYDYDGSQNFLILGCKNSKIDTFGDLIIKSKAFDNTNVKNIIIPLSVKEIESFAFSSNLSKVFYSGTEEQWNQILITENNYCLYNATIYFYSEQWPTELGNFWHYDADGVTPLIWGAEDIFEYTKVGSYIQINGLTELGKTMSELVIPTQMTYNDNGDILKLNVKDIRFDYYETENLRTLTILANFDEIDFYGLNNATNLSSIEFVGNSNFTLIDGKFVCEDVNNETVLRYILDPSADKTAPIILSEQINKVAPTSNYNIFENYTAIIVPTSVTEIDATYTDEPFYFLEGACPILNGSQTYTYYMWSDWNHDLQNPAYVK